ncbi:hypothetical protein J6590_088868 [Homalodisca vitripennis]|nr:hypothetical protein J6590_088868 [Homalodisca vitripennis]
MANRAVFDNTGLDGAFPSSNQNVPEKEETWILAYLKFAGATTSMLPRLGWLWGEAPEITARQHTSTQLCAGTGQVRVIDAVKYRKIHEDVMKKLDKLENEFLPQVMVDNTEVIFDTLRFLEPQTKELIIANTGQVPVQFEFIKKLDDPNYCKEWLNIEPYTGFIMPGEKCDIRLEVYVDKKSACKMNSGQDKLYDILVLHLDGGKDIFITVTGNYVPSFKSSGAFYRELSHRQTDRQIAM